MAQGTHVRRLLPENPQDVCGWRDFLASHTQGNIFCTPEAYEVFRRAKGYHPEVWAALQHDETILALLPLTKITLFDGVLRAATTRAIAYGGVALRPNARGQQALSHLLHVCATRTAKQALYTELRHLSDAHTIQPQLNQQHFNYAAHLNYRIDLPATPDALLQSLGSRTRKNIRQVRRRQEVTVEEATSETQLQNCYALMHQTYQAAQIPLADKSLFQAAFDVFHPKHMVKFWLASVDSKPAACSVELLYKDTVYGWYSGLDRAYGSYLPGEALMWHILQWSIQNGYHVYDFGGAGEPDEDYGVRDFKAKFGGRLVCYGRNIYVHRPGLLQLSQLGYTIARQWM